MFCHVHTGTLYGMDAYPVEVETDLSEGLPMTDMVGYLGSEVREAKERVRTALKNSGFILPPKRITINLSPANIRKQGTGFDLPIAISLMVCLGLIRQEDTENCCIMGELGLDGSVHGIAGVLPRVMMAKECGYQRCIVPKENSLEGSAVGGIEMIGVTHILEALHYLNGDATIEPVVFSGDDFLEQTEKNQADFSQLNGQKVLRRGLEIAAAGLHHTLIIGPPGAGKTMAAKRLPGILPELTLNESLEISKIYSISGLLSQDGIKHNRPFINPHHTCTAKALIGGGAIPKPGAVSLSHKGVLFLDELPEFKKEALEVLRQPLEERKVILSRTNGTYVYPASFLLVCAMNPCKCGYYPDRTRCSCTEYEIHQYLSKISGPLLDRMDLCLETKEIQYHELIATEKNESSEVIRQRVKAAREIQKDRFGKCEIMTNSEIGSSEIRKYCELGKKEQKLMEQAFHRLKLSARSYHRILRVARTIADLDCSEKIQEIHLCEAIQYRSSIIN